MNPTRDPFAPRIHIGQSWPDRDLPDPYAGEPPDAEHEARRREQMRQCDEDYRAWRQHRFASEFEAWRRARRSAAASGEATSEHPTDHRALESKPGGPPSEDTNLLFERS